MFNSLYMALFRSIATIGSWTMGSRALGFVRDILIASMLGAGQVTDAFFVALQLPNIFRRLFAEGAFNSAFIPIFTGELNDHGRVKAREFSGQILGFMLVFLIIVSLLAEIFMPEVISIIAGGFSENPKTFNLAVDCARLTFPYLFFVSIAAMFSGILNTDERFIAAAAAPLLLNIFLLASLIGIDIGWFIKPGQTLSWAVLFAGIGQLCWLSIACFRAGLLPRMPRLTLSPKVRRLFVLMMPGILGAGVYQINVLVGVRLATELPEGSVSFLYFADRVSQLPLGVVGAAIGVALLPLLTRQLKSGDDQGASASQNRAIEYSLLLTLPAMAALIVLPTPIIAVLFQRGEFGGDATVATANALVAFALGMPAYVLIKALAPGFFAREDTSTPVKIAIIACVLNVFLAIILMSFLAHVGIALATAISAWVNASGLAFLLYRRGMLNPDKRLFLRATGSCFASIGMALVLWKVSSWLVFWLSPGSYQGIIALAFLVIVGISVYVVLLQIIGVIRWNEMCSLLSKK